MVHIPHTHRNQEKFLDGIPQGDKTTVVLSFPASMRRNKFDEVKNKFLHVIVKASVWDAVQEFFLIPVCVRNVNHISQLLDCLVSVTFGITLDVPRILLVTISRR